MSILLDIKVCCDILQDSDQLTYGNLIHYISNLSHEYNEEISIIIKEWISFVYLDKVYQKENLNYNFIN